MENLISLNKIKSELTFCYNNWTVIYGSYVYGEYIPDHSDIDVAIITQIKDRKKNSEIWYSYLEKIPNNYDLKIFELLPLYIQIDIIQTYIVVFGNPYEISEYFYQYRKLWKDMVPRIKANQFQNVQEKLNLIEHRKKIIG